MTDFGYWQSLAQQRGQFMCDICFEGFPLDEAWTDVDGQRWTMCTECGDREQPT